jgi:hypothetical protein
MSYRIPFKELRHTSTGEVRTMPTSYRERGAAQGRRAERGKFEIRNLKSETRTEIRNEAIEKPAKGIP